MLGGIAWYLASAKGAHWAVLPLAVMGASTLVSYERAKAESLGLNAKGGLMERAERIVALCVSLAFSIVMIPVLFAMLGLTLVTAVQRFVMVWRRAAAPPRLHRDRPRRWELRLEARRAARRSSAGEERRRAWRRQVRTRP